MGIESSAHSQPTALERAFEIARSGRATSMTELRQILKTERYALTQITGSSLSRQLNALMRQSRAPAGSAGSGEPS